MGSITLYYNLFCFGTRKKGIQVGKDWSFTKWCQTITLNNFKTTSFFKVKFKMSWNLSGISVLCGQEHWPLWRVILHDQSSSNWKQDLHDRLITFPQNFISPAVSLLVLFIHICIPGFYFEEERWLVLRRLIILENFGDLKCNISRLQGQSRVLPSSSFFPLVLPANRLFLKSSNGMCPPWSLSAVQAKGKRWWGRRRKRKRSPAFSWIGALAAWPRSQGERVYWHRYKTARPLCKTALARTALCPHLCLRQLPSWKSFSQMDVHFLSSVY